VASIFRVRGGFDSAFRDDLTVFPAPARKDQLADFRHIARSQAQSSSGIGFPLTRFQLTLVMPKGSNNVARANSLRGLPVALRTMADMSLSAPVL